MRADSRRIEALRKTQAKSLSKRAKPPARGFSRYPAAANCERE
jgi:hypothetical protein